MAALGAPAGEEGVRALLGKVDLFVVDREEQLPRGVAAHEHPHEDEEGEPEGGGEPAGGDGRGIDSRGKWKLTC